MSTMLQNYNVYVSALYVRCRETKPSSTSNLSIVLKVMSSYVSDVTVSMNNCFRTWESFNRAPSMPKEIKNSCTEKSFQIPCDSLLSDDGTESSSSWEFVNKMISEMNIPFSLDHKLQWRASPVDEWISLANQDDVIRKILSLARREAKTISTDDHDQPKELQVSIKKEIILPHYDFQAMVNARRAEEQIQEITRAIERINRLAISLRMRCLRMLRESTEYASSEALIEQAIRESSEEAAGSKLIPASKSSIEALEEVIIVDGNIDTACSCTICMDNLVNGSRVSRMPCSHKFHKTCIENWLEKSHVCPLCRFELPTME